MVRLSSSVGCSVALVALLAHVASSAPSPIVFVNSFGGAVLEAKLNDAHRAQPLCSKSTNSYYRIWLDFERLLPFAQECWMQDFSCKFDNDTQTLQSVPGVELRTVDYGSCKGVATLDDTELMHYFKNFIEALGKHGYECGKNLAAAPWNWQYPPEQLEKDGYFDQMKALIEKMVSENGEKAVIMAHSNGNQVAHYFLTAYRGIDQAWKDAHVQKFMAIASPWLGCPNAIHPLVSGDVSWFTFYHVRLVNRLKFRKTARTFGSLAAILPNTFAPGASDQPLAYTDTKTYSAADVEELIHDLGDDELFEMYKAYAPKEGKVPAPGVPIHCIFGSEIPTEAIYDYRGKTFNDDPKISNIEGDGTVLMPSLRYCNNFRSMQSQSVQVTELPGLFHHTSIRNTTLINLVIQDIVGNSP